MTFPLRRTLSILVRPARTWRAIAAEPAPLASLAFGYALPLALVGPFATFVARRVVGVRVGHVLYRSSAEAALSEAAFSFGFAIAGLLLVTSIVRLLAPFFAARRRFAQAFEIAAFAYTPVWLGAVAVLAPRFGFVQFVALVYEVFLLQGGLVTVLGVPSRGRAVVFATVAVASAIGVAVAFGEFTAALAGGGG